MKNNTQKWYKLELGIGDWSKYSHNNVFIYFFKLTDIKYLGYGNVVRIVIYLFYP